MQTCISGRSVRSLLNNRHASVVHQRIRMFMEAVIDMRTLTCGLRHAHWLCNAGHQVSYTDIAASCVKRATMLTNKNIKQMLVMRLADFWDWLFLGLTVGRAPGGARRQAVREGIDRGVPPSHGHRHRCHSDRCLWRTQRSFGARYPIPALANFRTRSAVSVCTSPMILTPLCSDAPVAHTNRRALAAWGPVPPTLTS